MNSQTKKQRVPFGIKYAMIVNWVVITLFCGIVISSMIKQYLFLTQQNGATPNSKGYLLLGVASFFILSIPMSVVFFLNNGLSKARPWAKILQIVTSIISISAVFPLIILYYFLFDKKTKSFFSKSENKGRNIYWKIYFWFSLIICCFSYPYDERFRITEGLDMMVMFMSFIGLFAYVWREEIFNKLFWKVFFLLFVIWNFVHNYFFPNPNVEPDTMPILSLIILILIFTPLMIALFLLGKNNKRAITENGSGY